MLRMISAAVLAALLFAADARADSWALPTATAYEAADASARFSVTPRDLDSQLSYFEDGARGDPPRGLLEVSDGSGGWTRAWEIVLVNEVAPVSALVAPAGRYVVTFDNWHMVGVGQNVVVIYDREGRLVRSLSLSDLLPADYIEALSRSVSSIWWGGEHRLADDTLVLQVAIPSEERGATTYVDLPVELSTGRVLAPQSGAWSDAIAQAQRVAAAARTAGERADAAFRAPLVAPENADEREWHLYLTELFYRIDRSAEPTYPAVDVLRAPKRRDYADSERWLCEELHEPSGSVLMLASPASPENLLRVLAHCLAAAPYAAEFERIYVVIPPRYHAAVTITLAPTRAEIFTLDPATPIPQRPERLAARDRR